MATRRRFTPQFDPDCGDTLLTSARQDIVIGRWKGVRDLLRATRTDWLARSHRMRLLAHACAASSTVETWLAAEPRNPDALVLRAATETTRAFNLAIAAGQGRTIDPSRIDAAVIACHQATDACPRDPTPWISVVSVARLYPSGVRQEELERWWGELHQRDAYNLEGYLQVLRYYSARWHGTHGMMYDFARDAAGVAPLGSALPVLMQYARVEEYRCLTDDAKGQSSALVEISRHWDHDGAVSDVRRSWERWIMARPEGPLSPGEVHAINHLTHAACLAGLRDIASVLLRMLDGRAAQVPWSSTGDPSKQITKWHEKLLSGR